MRENIDKYGIEKNLTNEKTLMNMYMAGATLAIANRNIW